LKEKKGLERVTACASGVVTSGMGFHTPPTQLSRSCQLPATAVLTDNVLEILTQSKLQREATPPSLRTVPVVPGRPTTGGTGRGELFSSRFLAVRSPARGANHTHHTQGGATQPARLLTHYAYSTRSNTKKLALVMLACGLGS
jgi:hypothetical protein